MFWGNFSSTCEKKGTSPTALVKSLKISSSVVTNWKRGGIPNGETLLKIADELDCSVDYLLGRDKYVNPQPQEQPTEIKIAPVPEDEGITMYRQLDGFDQAEIRGEMKQMLKAEKYRQDSAEMA